MYLKEMLAHQDWLATSKLLFLRLIRQVLIFQASPRPRPHRMVSTCHLVEPDVSCSIIWLDQVSHKKRNLLALQQYQDWNRCGFPRNPSHLLLCNSKKQQTAENVVKFPQDGRSVHQ